METYLRCFCAHKPFDWVKWVPWAQFWYNTTWYGSAKMSPYQVLYGRPPPTISSYIPKTARLQSVEDEVVDRDVTLQLLKDNLVKAQERMKKLADKNRSEREFQVGDLVFLRLQPLGRFLLEAGDLKNSHLFSLDLIQYYKELVWLLISWICLQKPVFIRFFMFLNLKGSWVTLFKFNIRYQQIL